MFQPLRRTKEREPTVETLDRGIVRLSVSDAERRVLHHEYRWTSVAETRRGGLMHARAAEGVYVVLDPL